MTNLHLKDLEKESNILRAICSMLFEEIGLKCIKYQCDVLDKNKGKLQQNKGLPWPWKHSVLLSLTNSGLPPKGE